MVIPEDEKKEIIGTAPETAPAQSGRKVLFYVVHSEGDPEKLVEFLEATPNFHPTLIFPAGYFSSEQSTATISRFKTLRNSGQIEIALTLSNQPILPLIADLTNEAKKAAGWKVNFSWPADVGGQIARGSGMHQKRWGVLPSGFYPPYLSLSATAADLVKQFRFDWVLAKPGTEPGAAYVGSTAFIVPILAQGDTDDEIVDQAMAARLSLVDSNNFETPRREVEFLKLLAQKSAGWSTPIEWTLAKTWATEISKDDLLPSNASIYEKDYSAWVASDRQRLAWMALADARDVIETYKNSGRANLKRLDAALEEMYTAEAGDFLLSLGQSKFVSTLSERSFLATLANVYRLTGVEVPSGLNVWFSTARWKKTAASSTTEGAGPFYVDGPDSMKWNDASGDEGGEKSVVYPVGKYPAGSFDLRSFSVDSVDTDVRFSVTFGGTLNSNTHLVLPLVDVYVDVNRLSGAGSQDVLPGRRGGQVSRDAAWEYAIAFSPLGAALYQAVPGGSPRMINSKAVSTDAGGNKVMVSFPKSLLRGSPKQWRLTVGLSGSESRKIGQDFVSVPVLENAGDRNFGGAGVAASVSYVDLLAETTNEQRYLLAVPSTERFVLPWVEAQ